MAKKLSTAMSGLSNARKLALIVAAGCAVLAIFFLSLVLAFRLGWVAPGYNANYEAKSVAADPKPLSLPVLPDISGFTPEAVRAMIPAIAPGKASAVTMKSSTYLAFMGVDVDNALESYAEWQDQEIPYIVELSEGVFDLESVHNALQDGHLVEKVNGIWVIQVPIIVLPGATLVINGKDNSVRLSSGKGAFISNFGKLFIVDTTIQGWLVENDAPALFQEDSQFRPYLAFWSGSQTFLAASHFSNLGYDYTKTYGISFASSVIMRRRNLETPKVTGWVTGCTFEDMYYGLYSYEADDVVIVNNVYKDNIIYGIDPHDRSQRLIIAGNETFGTKKKHGIIVSREVNDSWIFNNHSHDNHGAGIMLDRNSRNNIVSGNLIERNGSDGLVFIESPDNSSWNNRILNNKKNGIRVRNSWNLTFRGETVVGNGGYGMAAYAVKLDDQKGRDLEIDPYQMRVGFDLADSEFSSSDLGHFQFFNIQSASLARLRLIDAPYSFRGDVRAYDTLLFKAATTPGLVATIRLNDKGKIRGEKAGD